MNRKKRERPFGADDGSTMRLHFITGALQVPISYHLPPAVLVCVCVWDVCIVHRVKMVTPFRTGDWYWYRKDILYTKRWLAFVMEGENWSIKLTCEGTVGRVELATGNRCFCCTPSEPSGRAVPVDGLNRFDEFAVLHCWRRISTGFGVCWRW